MSSSEHNTLLIKVKPENSIIKHEGISINLDSLNHVSSDNLHSAQEFDIPFCQVIPDAPSISLLESPRKSKISTKRNQKRNKEHNQHRTANSSWFKIPGIGEWLGAMTEKPNFVACKLCKIPIRAHLHDLKKHAQSIKHRKSTLLKANSTEESIAIESMDCQDVIEANLLIGESDFDHTPSISNDIKSLQDNHSPISIGFIGAGNIVQSLISGLLSNGIVDANKVVVSAPSEKNLNKFKPLGIKTTHNNNIVVQECDVVFLAVKPQVIVEALANLDPILRPKSPLFVSVISGLSILHLEGMLTSHSISNPKVVRLVPNTPCMVLQGSCVYAKGTNIDTLDNAMIKNMLGSLGVCLEIPENQIDAATGLSSSGPAYIYSIIEAMADGGVKMGLSRDTALELAAQAVKGAGTMVLETGKHPGRLKDEVCTPSGPAISGMHVLEEFGVRHALISAIQAATLRSKDKP